MNGFNPGQAGTETWVQLGWPANAGSNSDSLSSQMPCRVSSDVHEWINDPTVPFVVPGETHITDNSPRSPVEEVPVGFTCSCR